MDGPLSWADWLALDIGNPDWLVPGLLERGGGCLLHGGPRSYKSFLMLQLCLDLAAGQTVWGMFPTTVARRTLLLQAEGSRRSWRQRMLNLRNDYPASLPFWSRHALTTKIDTPAGNKLVCSDLDSTQADLVVVDPIANFFTGADTDPTAIERWRFVSNGWRERFGCAVVWVHHDRQPLRFSVRGELQTLDGGMEEARGRTELIGWADLVMGMRRRDDVTEVRVQKIRDDPDGQSFSLRFSAGRLSVVDRSDSVEKAILAQLAHGTAWLSDVSQTVAGEFAVQPRTVERAVARLQERGLLQTTQVGGRKLRVSLKDGKLHEAGTA